MIHQEIRDLPPEERIGDVLKEEELLVHTEESHRETLEGIAREETVRPHTGP